MPLIDLKTNLKSLKYGMDQPGGGWSGQPFVQFPIPGEGVTSPTMLDFYKSNRVSLDYPIRGGGAQFNIGNQTFTVSSELDKSRIKKFFDSKPRGDAFIKKQVGLQLSNPKIETGNSLYGLDGQKIIPGVLENTRVYNNGKNTLAQVAASGTGTHIPRFGSFPINPTAVYYAKTVGRQLDMEADKAAEANRLINLYKLKMVNTTQQIANADTLNNINKINELGISLNRNLMFQYLGGPNSVYGIGSTTIRRYEDTTQAAKKSGMNSTYDSLMNKKVTGVIQGRLPINKIGLSNGQDIVAITRAFEIESNQKGEKNLARAIREANAELNIVEIDGEKFEKNTIDERFYTYSTNNALKTVIDKLNISEAKTVNGEDPWTSKEGVAQDDLIKFGFECIDNDDPNRSLFLQFRAFLTSGLTDNHQAQWNQFKYMGRGEDFYTYQGFSRQISLGFRIAAGSEAELLPLYNKLNALVSQIYPDYSPKTSFMRAPIVKLTVGNYLYRVPGILESVNIVVANDATWEIKDENQLPQYLDVSISFKPIMSMLPQRSSLEFIQNSTRQPDKDYSPATPTPKTKIDFDINTDKAIENDGGVIENRLLKNNPYDRIKQVSVLDNLGKYPLSKIRG